MSTHKFSLCTALRPNRVQNAFRSCAKDLVPNFTSLHAAEDICKPLTHHDGYIAPFPLLFPGLSCLIFKVPHMQLCNYED